VWSSLASSALATTYVVDSNGGGQFTDIQPAIDAAQPGDVLLVLTGSYGSFTLTKGLTIIGFAAPAVAGAASILGIPPDETAVVVNFHPSLLSIGGCMGPVLVQDVSSAAHVDVQQSADVRLLRVSAQPPAGPTVNGCTVNGSRVEIARCVFGGSDVPACTPSRPPDGGIGLRLSHTCRVQVALSQIGGGSGSLCFDNNLYGGSGNSGILLGMGDMLFLAGGGLSHITGGGSGGDAGLFNCRHDGVSGAGIYNDGGELWYSGATIYGPPFYVGHGCQMFDGVAIGGQGGTLVTPDDPTLDVQADATAGGSAMYTLRAPPGATAILYFGRHAIVTPTPHVLIEQLTPKSRVVNLGTIPASGQATFTWPIAAGLPPGTLWIAQSEVTLASGEARRTNSVPVVLH
jgi:hypothetical protein